MKKEPWYLRPEAWWSAVIIGAIGFYLVPLIIGALAVDFADMMAYWPVFFGSIPPFAVLIALTSVIGGVIGIALLSARSLANLRIAWSTERTKAAARFREANELIFSSDNAARSAGHGMMVDVARRFPNDYAGLALNTVHSSIESRAHKDWDTISDFSYDQTKKPWVWPTSDKAVTYGIWCLCEIANIGHFNRQVFAFDRCYFGLRQMPPLHPHLAQLINCTFTHVSFIEWSFEGVQSGAVVSRLEFRNCVFNSCNLRFWPLPTSENSDGNPPSIEFVNCYVDTDDDQFARETTLNGETLTLTDRNGSFYYKNDSWVQTERHTI